MYEALPQCHSYDLHDRTDLLKKQYVRTATASMKIYETPSKRKWTTFPLHDILLPVLMVVLGIGTAVVLGIYANHTRSTGSFQCAPDGTLVFPEQTLKPVLEAKYFFTITMAWGDFELSTVKIIDICWDLFIGRGGQLLLSFLAFSALRKSTSMSLGQRPWHLPALTRLTLDPVSLTGLWAAVRDILEHDQARLFGFIFVITYILAFSTVASAMTGYRSRMEPSYLQTDGTTLPLGNRKLIEVYPIRLANRTITSNTMCDVRTEPENACFSEYWGCDVLPDRECYNAWERCMPSSDSSTC